MKIGILGGGLTGLTIGYLLKQKGIEFDILEKELDCGGLMQSTTENGFTFDVGGSHIIFSKDKESLDFLTDILGKNIVKNRRNTKILFRGRYVKYPFENGLADLPGQDNFECVKYFVDNLVMKEKGIVENPKNLKDWFYYNFGKGIAEKYLLPYNEKIWKHDMEKTSMEWVERIPNPPVEDIIKSSIGIETEGYAHQLHFFYPRTGGIVSIIKSLESGLKSYITTGFDVSAIEKINGKWLVSSSKEKRVYDRIVSTIPIQSLVNSMDSPAPVKKASSELKYNSLVSVMIGVNKKHLNDLSWLYIPDREILTHRISFPSNYSDKNSPLAASSILAEITCHFNDEIWNMPEEKIIARVLDDLEKLDIIKKSEVCFSKVAKMKYAYVINDLDYQKNNAIIKNHFDQMGIILLGRFSEFKYLNMDNCVRNALEIVKKGF
jgi:protoporphyrinogen oxidase